MTLDEAIQHAEEVAEEKDKEADRIYRAYSIFPSVNDALEYDDCVACAEEHRQLAEWLKDYKRLLEQERVRPKERWMIIKDRYKVCPLCHFRLDTWDGNIEPTEFKFCPYCGEDMRGDKE